MLREKDLSYDERKLLKQKIDKAKRRQQKVKKGKAPADKKRPERIENISSLALEYSSGDPLEALEAAVGAISK